MPGGQKRYFNGICTSLAQGMRGIDHTPFQMEVSPHLWLLTLRSRSRIFQNLTVPEILKQVLDIPDVVYELEGTFHPRTYCVQYRETDFQFASRLMEDEGIYYYFNHKASSHQMVVSNKAAFPELQPGDLLLQQAEGTHVQQELITRWQKRQQLRSLKVTLRDYHFQMPPKSLEAVQEIQADVKVGKVEHKLRLGETDGLEIYDWPGAYSHRFDAIDRGGAERPDELQKLLQDNERTAKIRMEEEAAEAISVQGVSQYRHLVSGHTFTLKEQVVVPYEGISSHDGKYVLTTVSHTGRMSGTYRSGDSQEFLYNNSFTAIPAGLHYRPQRSTPRPVVTGTQTAVVVGPKGKEVFVDKYGRVKVQFHWDRQGKNDADSSCWVRVSQIWAGKGWGAFFWPRLGHEVVVAFEEGDPDRPIIVGSVYNADNMPPFALPRSYLLNGIKSCSERGHPHSKCNGIVFHDDLGNEHVQIHSEQHGISTNESSHRTHIGAIHQQIVGTLPLPGSGSGGKGGPTPSPPPPAPPPGRGDDQPFQTDLGGSLAASIDLVIGEKYEATAGLKFEQRFGGKVEYYLSPNFWVDKHLPGPTADPLSGMPFLAGLTALLGKTEIKMSTEASILYGLGIEIHHGKKVEYTPDDATWTMLQSGPLMVEAIGVLQLAAMLLGGTLNSDSAFWKTQSGSSFNSRGNTSL